MLDAGSIPATSTNFKHSSAQVVLVNLMILTSCADKFTSSEFLIIKAKKYETIIEAKKMKTLDEVDVEFDNAYNCAFIVEKEKNPDGFTSYQFYDFYKSQYHVDKFDKEQFLKECEEFSSYKKEINNWESLLLAFAALPFVHSHYIKMPLSCRIISIFDMEIRATGSKKWATKPYIRKSKKLDIQTGAKHIKLYKYRIKQLKNIFANFEVNDRILETEKSKLIIEINQQNLGVSYLDDLKENPYRDFIVNLKFYKSMEFFKKLCKELNYIADIQTRFQYIAARFFIQHKTIMLRENIFPGEAVRNNANLEILAMKGAKIAMKSAKLISKTKRKWKNNGLCENCGGKFEEVRINDSYYNICRCGSRKFLRDVPRYKPSPTNINSFSSSYESSFKEANPDAYFELRGRQMDENFRNYGNIHGPGGGYSPDKDYTGKG